MLQQVEEGRELQLPAQRALAAQARPEEPTPVVERMRRAMQQQPAQEVIPFMEVPGALQQAWWGLGQGIQQAAWGLGEELVKKIEKFIEAPPPARTIQNA